MYPLVFSLAALIIIVFYLSGKPDKQREQRQYPRRREPYVDPASYAQQCIDTAQKVREEGGPKQVDHQPLADGVSRNRRSPGKRKNPNPTRTSVPQDSVPVSSD